MRHQAWTLAFVTIAPVTWMVGQFLAILNRPPEWQIMDPTYTYLVNSVEVGQGLPAAHYQHPGFPVFWFLGPILRLAEGVSGGQGLNSALVLRTHFLFDVSSFALVALQVSALIFASVVLARRLSIVSALIFQALVLSLGAASSDVGPLGMQAALALILIGLIGPLLTDARTTIGTPRQILIGIVLALAILTKLTSLPLLFFISPLLGIRQLVRVAAVTLIVGFVGTLGSVRGAAIDMAVFFARVLPTTGRRPDETDGSLLSGLATIPSNLASVRLEMIVVIVCFVLIALRPPQPPFTRRPRYLVEGLTLGIAVAVLAGIKGFQPADFIAMVPPIAAVGAVTYHYVFSSLRERSRRWVSVVSTLIVIPVIAAALAEGIRNSTRDSLSMEKMNAVSYLEGRLRSGRPTITSGSIPTPATALFFGLGFSQRSFAPELIEAYPGYLDFKMQNSLIYVFDESGEVEVTCQQLKKLADTGDLEFIPGREMQLPINSSQYASIDLEVVQSIGGWDVYRVTSVSCPAVN